MNWRMQGSAKGSPLNRRTRLACRPGCPIRSGFQDLSRAPCRRTHPDLLAEHPVEAGLGCEARLQGQIEQVRVFLIQPRLYRFNAEAVDDGVEVSAQAFVERL